MASFKDLSSGRYMGADDVVDGTSVKLEAMAVETARNPGTGEDEEVEVMRFQGVKQGLILTKTRAKQLGAIGKELDWLDTSDPIPANFPILELYLVDTTMGQGVRIRVAPDQSVPNF